MTPGQVIAEASAALQAALDDLELTAGVSPLLQFHAHGVAVYPGRARHRIDERVRSRLIVEFRRIGWGFSTELASDLRHAAQLNFTHPAYLTKVGY